jgi:2-polyprenyl-6-methoxyphenol hydroxylase-like FAD-dependent oxidoreductase
MRCKSLKRHLNQRQKVNISYLQILRLSLTKAIGDYFSIGPSSTKVFKNWPELEADHDRVAWYPQLAYVRSNGEYLIPPEDLLPSATKTSEESAPPIKIHRHLRSRLQRILLEQLQRIGLSVQYGHRVTKYMEDAKKGIIELENGEQMEADIVVAADGIGTRSYELVLGKPTRARSSGYAMYRTCYPVEYALVDPEVDQRFKIQDNGRPVAELWLG